MRLVDEKRYSELQSEGLLKVEPCRFSDGARIELAVGGKMFIAPAEIDPSSRVSWQEEQVDHCSLKSGHFYLVLTTQKLRLPDFVFGLLYTRSQWARCGLDVIGSSAFVSPGFGKRKPAPIVLELRPRVNLKGLSAGDVLAGLVLFEHDRPLRLGKLDHADRFPLNVSD